MDAALNDRQVDPVAWVQEQPECPLQQVRAVQVALSLRDMATAHALLPTLPDIAPVRGIRLLALGALGQWDEVLQERPQPRGYAPLDLEEMVHAWTAYGVAATQRERYEDAVIAAHMALGLASALGMLNRCQMLSLELERVSVLAGRPNPEQVGRLLMTSMSDTRRMWGQRVMAEGHMALGSYGLALRALGAPGEDGPEDAALREYLHTIMRLPPARQASDPLLTPALPYLRLAQAAQRVALNEKVFNLEGITGQPQSNYALMLKASGMYKAGLLQPAADLFLSLRPSQPDQVFYRWTYLLACFVAGARVPDPHLLPARIRDSIDAMPPEGDLLSSMVYFAPEVLTLLVLADQRVGTHARLRQLDLMRMPMLAGKVVRYLGADHTVPGSIGTAEVLEAMGVPQKLPLPPEVKRMREKLAHVPARRVNLGHVAVGCLRMIRACREVYADPHLVIAWKESYRAVWGLLTPDVHKVLMPLPEYNPATLR